MSSDDVVKYASYWCEEIIENAIKLGLKIIDLKDHNFVEQKLTKHILEQKPKFIFLNGHGDEYSARGHNQEAVILINKNDHLLKEKVAHILSCHTGIFLAQSAIDKGCIGYLGYNHYFYIWFLEREPEKDIIAKMFQEAVNVASIALMMGASVKEAFEKSQEVYDKRINECKGRYFNPNIIEQKDYLQEVIGALLWNKNHQVYLSVEE